MNKMQRSAQSVQQLNRIGHRGSTPHLFIPRYFWEEIIMVEINLTTEDVKERMLEVLAIIADVADDYLAEGDMQAFIELQCIMGLLEDSISEE
jgi:hypothetical protein